MTKLLEQAFKKASELTEAEQNIIARWVPEELESEKKWDKAFAASQDLLGKLADEALNDYAKGKTKPLSIKEL
jgi:hypothetical protein